MKIWRGTSVDWHGKIRLEIKLISNIHHKEICKKRQSLPPIEPIRQVATENLLLQCMRSKLPRHTLRKTDLETCRLAVGSIDRGHSVFRHPNIIHGQMNLLSNTGVPKLGRMRRTVFIHHIDSIV